MIFGVSLTMLGALLLILLVIGVRASCRPARAVAAPSCGACGYSTKGLIGSACPECGRSLFEVGINTGALARRLGRSRLIASLSFATAGYLIGTLLFVILQSFIQLGALGSANISEESYLRLGLSLTVPPALLGFAIGLVSGRGVRSETVHTQRE